MKCVAVARSRTRRRPNRRRGSPPAPEIKRQSATPLAIVVDELFEVTLFIELAEQEVGQYGVVKDHHAGALQGTAIDFLRQVLQHFGADYQIKRAIPER